MSKSEAMRNQATVNLQAQIDFIRAERDRLKDAVESARVEIERVTEDLQAARDHLNEERSHYIERGKENARLRQVNEDWMKYTAKALRQVDRLREENRSLVQTIRRVLRAAPVEES